MDNPTVAVTEPEQVGALPPEEKKLLAGQLEKNVQLYKYFFIGACVSIVILIGVIIAPAVYVALRKEQKKLEEINHAELPVFRISGILSSKYVGAERASMYALSVGDFTLPEIASDPNAVKSLIGLQVSAEYMPDIRKNRRIYDSNGTGYNFITKTATTS